MGEHAEAQSEESGSVPVPTADTGENRAEQISRVGRGFVIAWALAILLIELGTGTWTVWTNLSNRQRSVERHLARMSLKSASEKNEPEKTPPPGLEKSVPAVVRAGLYLDQVEQVSIRDQSWSAEFFIWFNWTDPQLQPGETFRLVGGEIESRQKLASRENGKDRYALYRVSAKITKVFDVTRYPLDDHLLSIQVEDGERQSYQLRYVADVMNSALSSRLILANYAISPHMELIVRPHGYRSSRGDPQLPDTYRATYSQLVFAVAIYRQDYGMYIKLFQGLFVALACAFVVFCIKPTHVDPRFGLGVGALFAAIANSYIAATMLPETGTLTMIDMVNGIGLATIFLTVVQSTISLYLYDNLGLEALSRLFDRVSLYVFTLGAIALNLIIPITAKW
jgi:hypothetical protein